MSFSDSWLRWRAQVDLDEYEKRWDVMAEAGQNVHGEADYVLAYGPKSVLDAGCGMGRVGIEIGRRGVAVVGVDLDPEMLERAQKNGPDLRWQKANLATLELGATFDVVLMAGNVLPFAKDEERPMIIRSLCNHVAPDGLLVSGSSLWPNWPSVSDYDRWCGENGFELVERYAAWTKEPFVPEIADYAVSTYRRG